MADQGVHERDEPDFNRLALWVDAANDSIQAVRRRQKRESIWPTQKTTGLGNRVWLWLKANNDYIDSLPTAPGPIGDFFDGDPFQSSENSDC